MKSLRHDIGSIFQPIFHLFGWILAFCYGIIPNYAIAIVMLTVIIMGALTPFTIKSTKSMMSMQKLQPEIKLSLIHISTYTWPLLTISVICRKKKVSSRVRI